MVTGRSVSKAIRDWVVVRRCRRIQNRQCLQTSTLVTHSNDHPDVPTPQLYISDFNCQHVNWGYNTTSLDGESLDSWVASNNLGLLYNPKETASLFSRRWNVGTRPGLREPRPLRRWRTGHTRLATVSPPGSSTNSCLTYERFQHLRVTVSPNLSDQKSLLLPSVA